MRALPAEWAAIHSFSEAEDKNDGPLPGHSDQSKGIQQGHSLAAFALRG